MPPVIQSRSANTKLAAESRACQGAEAGASLHAYTGSGAGRVAGPRYKKKNAPTSTRRSAAGRAARNRFVSSGIDAELACDDIAVETDHGLSVDDNDGNAQRAG